METTLTVRLKIKLYLNERKQRNKIEIAYNKVK